MARPSQAFLEASRSRLEDILTRQIPLGGAMELKLGRLDSEGIALQAPLEPNINDKGTAFGGAMTSLMILAGWSLGRLVLLDEDSPAELVIAEAAITFSAPADGAMEARCGWPAAAVLEGFRARLDERGRARLDLEPALYHAGGLVATLRARYAAVDRDRQRKRKTA